MIRCKANHLLFCVVFVFQAFGFVTETHAQNQPTLEKIVAVWKQRQDNTRTFDFQWEEVRMYAKGSMPVLKGDAQPPEDVTQSCRSSLQVDGDLMRVWSNTPPWSPQSGKFVPREHLSVFDGNNEKVFYDQADPSVQATVTNKAGVISIYQYNQDVVDYHIWPILLMYRPLHRDMGRFSKHNEWEMTGEKGVAQGRDCLILQKRKQSITEKCWVDFERDCTVVRYEFITNYRFQVDISYKNVADQGWMPANWKTVEYLPKGTLKESSQFEVTGYTINKPLPEELFDFKFPVDTWVTNYKNKTDYIVREDGGKRLITEAERMRGVTYERLLETESGEAGLRPHGRKPWQIFLALGFLGLFLIALVLRIRWRQKRS